MRIVDFPHGSGIALSGTNRVQSLRDILQRGPLAGSCPC
jgi:hypothetical protein